MATPALPQAAAAPPASTSPTSGPSDEPPLKSMVRSHLIAGVDQPVVRIENMFPATRPSVFSLKQPDTPSIRELAALLGHFMRVDIPDGRWFIGKFVCVDGGRNIIMKETWEHRRFTWKDESGTECSKEDKRNLGSVMVPGKYVLSVKIDRNRPPLPPVKPAATAAPKGKGKSRGQQRKRRF